MRPTRLKKLKLSELSLVDRPANPHAVVVIAKRVPAQKTKPVISFTDALNVLKRTATPRPVRRHGTPTRRNSP